MPPRSCPIGAELGHDGLADVRVWAPKREQIVVEYDDAGRLAPAKLEREPNGYFRGRFPARAGTRYSLRLDRESRLFPDPASRFQPEGPHGPSEVVDPAAFAWTDSAWRGITLDRAVFYEMHIGTFTQEGTWRAAIEQLPELARLGITVLEVMPIAEFPGRFGWGYDGVDQFAPSHLYGRPDEFRQFIDQAHAHGLGVILDVVYNHFGPDGNYLTQFSDDYFTDRYANEWGEAINFDGPNSGPVREFFLANAAYWIREYHLDGLRLDATQQIFDESDEHIIAAITRAVRQAAGRRGTLIVAENEEQHSHLVRPLNAGGYGIDALWNDDFHHSAHVALTGKNPAYYTDYLGEPQELISTVKWGYLYQGQYYRWQKKRRGTPALNLSPRQFVTYLDNHDQVANSARGLRTDRLTSPGRLRAMTALLLLGPGTPMLFQGQEFAASAPFLYFADHEPELAEKVSRGRAEFLSQFPDIALPATQALLANPADPQTFERCRLSFSERESHRPIYALHCDLLKLRREDPVFQNVRPRGVDGAVLAPAAFVLRFFGDDDDRLLLVNLGRDRYLLVAPEPLLAPPAGRRWQMLWSSDDVRYGGSGTPAVETENGWRLPGEAAIVMVSSSPGEGRVP